MKKKRIWLKILLSMLLALCISACSGDTKKPLWRLARDPLWIPLNLPGKEQSMLGFTNDLMSMIAKEEDFRFELISVPSRDLMADLDNGIYDGFFGGLMPDYQSRGKYNFSNPIYLLGPVLVVSKNSTIKSLEDIAGKTVGIMSDVNPIFETKFTTDLNLRVFRNTTTALDSLRQNQIDGLIIFALPAYNNISALFPNSLKVITDPLTLEGIRLIVHKSAQSEKFIDQFNKGLHSLKEKGVYQKLLDKWGLVNTVTTQEPLGVPKDPEP